MTIEINEGRGVGPNKDHIMLHLEHIDADTLHQRLPGITETARIFCGVDVTREPIPVLPTVHYNMGGIPTNYHGEVISAANGNENSRPWPDGHWRSSLCVGAWCEPSWHQFTAGHRCVWTRCCTSRCRDMYPWGGPARSAPQAATDKALERFDRMRHASGEAGAAGIRLEMQQAMQRHAAVFRSSGSLSDGVATMDKVAAQMGDIGVKDKSLIWNTDLVEALELENLMGQALVTIRSADQRQESRGAHAQDWPERDDENWMKHTVMWLDENNKSKLDYRGVVMNTLSNDVAPIPPAPRVY